MLAFLTSARRGRRGRERAQVPHESERETKLNEADYQVGVAPAATQREGGRQQQRAERNADAPETVQPIHVAR